MRKGKKARKSGPVRTLFAPAWLPYAALELLTVLAYSPTLTAPLLGFDDDSYIVKMSYLPLWARLRYVWSPATVGFGWYPLTHFSFVVEWLLRGLWLPGYHLTNILLHAGNAVLVWRVLALLAACLVWRVQHVFVRTCGVLLVLLTLGIVTWTQARLYQHPQHLWTTVLAHNPTSARAHHQLAVLLVHDGHPDRALPHLETARRLAPDDAEVRFYHARALAELGRLEDALAEAWVAARLQPTWPEPYQLLAQVYAAHGEHGKARTCANEARKRDHGHQYAPQ